MTRKYEPGKNPNSLANLKRAAGPGRPKLSPEEKEARKKAHLEIRQHMKAYLSNGEAASDFEKVRQKKPDVALDLAMNRIYGRTEKPQGEITRGQVNVLIQILTGQRPSDMRTDSISAVEEELIKKVPTLAEK